MEKESLAERPLVTVKKSGGYDAEALMAAKSANDPNHSIMVTLNSFYTTPLRQSGLDLEVLTFAPVARIAEDTFLLWVHADTGITSSEQWLEVAREQGRKWVMGGTGYNSEDWQANKSKKSLMGDLMSGEQLSDYWRDQLDNHEQSLRSSGAIR